MKKKLMMLFSGCLIVLIVSSLSSCVMIKNLFIKAEDIPGDMQKVVTIKCSDVLPENLSELLPSNIKNDLDRQTQKALIRQFIPVEIIEQIILNHFSGEENEKEFQFSHHLIMDSNINKDFDEIELPSLKKSVILEKEVDQDFFIEVKKKLEEKSTEVIFSPDLYVYGIDLSSNIFFDITHPQIKGSVKVLTSVFVSKNDFNLNERELIKEENFISGTEKKISFMDDADWVLVSLINNPGKMFVRIPTELTIEGIVSNIRLETDFDMDIELSFSISVNNIERPIQDGYEWEIKDFTINKFLLRNMVVEGFDFSKDLAEAKLTVSGNINVGLK